MLYLKLAVQLALRDLLYYNGCISIYVKSMKRARKLFVYKRIQKDHSRHVTVKFLEDWDVN